MVNLDAIDLVKDFGCHESANHIVESVVNFTVKPTDSEVLARCSLIFDYILNRAMEKIDADPVEFEVSVEHGD